MELPPTADAVLEDINVLFTKSTHNLENANWSQVNRSEYLEIVRLRIKECAAYSHVKINETRAKSEISEQGVPFALLAAHQKIDGAERAPVHLSGPVSRAPEKNPHTEAEGA